MALSRGRQPVDFCCPWVCHLTATMPYVSLRYLFPPSGLAVIVIRFSFMGVWDQRSQGGAVSATLSSSTRTIPYDGQWEYMYYFHGAPFQYKDHLSRYRNSHDEDETVSAKQWRHVVPLNTKGTSKSRIPFCGESALDSPHKEPVMQTVFPYNDVGMWLSNFHNVNSYTGMKASLYRKGPCILTQHKVVPLSSAVHNKIVPEILINCSLVNE